MTMTSTTDPRVSVARALIQHMDEVTNNVTGTELPDLENALRGLLEYVDQHALLSHDELVVVSDILGRVQAAMESGDQELLRTAAGFTLNAEFRSALEKIDAAKLATGPGQS